MSSPKPILLYTWKTPNGHKVQVFLEELKAAYGTDVIDYDVEFIDISKNIQKEDWFIKLNPNGRIPVIVDRKRDNFVVFETGAILGYLQQYYDTENKFGFDVTKEPNYFSETVQWIFFAHGGVGPMQGQAAHFNKFAPEQIPYAQKRFTAEVKRLYGVLDIRLAGRDWLVGPGRGKYSIADINAVTWVRIHAFTGVETLEEWPNVKAWVARANERPALQAGVSLEPKA
ncbi:hypothetical protein NM688_g4458 [Phlebia brevispora]|uniref:Uncharacterized protein n=1 Tax=Phlebia brevispora TaxID=194682 RepID=A0ACC1T304_9APHY|nr:hypothetical protein NM688_g4458 [Phlebia brevispora]